jgi:hypothetical protein
VLLVRRIRELLYEQGFTISGARNQLAEFADSEFDADPVDSAFDAQAVVPAALAIPHHGELAVALATNKTVALASYIPKLTSDGVALTPIQVREELLSIRDLLSH